MAVGIVLDFAGGTMAHYDEVVRKMDLGGRMPPGGLFHAAGTTQTGLRVVDVWEDMATFAAFRDARIAPLGIEAGLAEPQVHVVEVAEQREGSGNTPVLVQVVKLPGVDAATFRAADEKIVPGGQPPAALTFHVNGSYDGGWCVIDSWDDLAAYRRFMDERVGPNVDASLLSGPPEIEVLEIQATLSPGARATA